MADNNIKAVIKQNVIKAIITSAGPKGEQGEQGLTGAGSNIRVYTWVLDNPAVGGIPGPKLKEHHTVTSIESYTTQPTSVTFNIEERSTIALNGSNLLASDQVADTDGASDTTFSDSSLGVDSWLWLDISAVSGTPGKLVVTLSATV